MLLQNCGIKKKYKKMFVIILLKKNIKYETTILSFIQTYQAFFWIQLINSIFFSFNRNVNPNTILFNWTSENTPAFNDIENHL